MKTMLLAFAIAIGVGVGAMMTLDQVWQKTSGDTYATGGARVGDPGHNLVGADWYAGRKS
jgi:hypothetical protein